MKPLGPMVVETELLEGGTVAMAECTPVLVRLSRQAVFAPETGQYITSTPERIPCIVHSTFWGIHHD